MHVLENPNSFSFLASSSTYKVKLLSVLVDQMLFFQNTETLSILFEIEVCTENFCHCPRCVITIRKHHACPPCCQTGCTEFPLWYYFAVFPRHASPLDSWIFFHPVSLRYLMLSLLLNLFWNRLLPLIAIFSLSTILASSVTLNSI